MDLNVLVEAKNEYYDQLTEIMCPFMIEAFQKLYKDAAKMSKGKKVLLQFQAVLQEVPNWNPKMTSDHVTAITDSCSWFNDLMAAAFVSYVKILSSVRLNNTNQKVSIKLPSNELFVQGVYNLAAEDIYNDPYVFNEAMTDRERIVALRKRFRECIDSNIRKMAPIQEILKTYMTTSDNKEIDFNVNADEDLEDTEDPDISDELPVVDEPVSPSNEEEGAPLASDSNEIQPADPMEVGDILDETPGGMEEEDIPMGDELGTPIGQLPEISSADIPAEREPGTKNIQVGKFKEDVLFHDAPDR